jgi:hypothetical protein
MPTTALAETTMGSTRQKPSPVTARSLAGPAETIDDVDYATMEWVDWYTTPARCTACSNTSRPTSTRAPITLNSRLPAGDVSTMKSASNPERFTIRLALNLGRRGGAVQQFQGCVSCEADDDIERLHQPHPSNRGRHRLPASQRQLIDIHDGLSYQ